jgi:hypothetical protein
MHRRISNAGIQASGRVHVRGIRLLREPVTSVVLPLPTGAAMRKLVCLVALIIVGCDSARSPISSSNRTGKWQ